MLEAKFKGTLKWSDRHVVLGHNLTVKRSEKKETSFLIGF